MANDKNPIADRVQKMKAILDAAKQAGEKVREEKEATSQAETGQPVHSPEQPPS